MTAVETWNSSPNSRSLYHHNSASIEHNAGATAERSEWNNSLVTHTKEIPLKVNTKEGLKCTTWSPPELENPWEILLTDFPGPGSAVLVLTSLTPYSSRLHLGLMPGCGKKKKYLMGNITSKWGLDTSSSGTALSSCFLSAKHSLFSLQYPLAESMIHVFMIIFRQLKAPLQSEEKIMLLVEIVKKSQSWLKAQDEMHWLLFNI